MLLSIIFELKSATSARLPSYLGRANQAQLMAWLDQIDPGLASDLHAASELRPVTCSSLLGSSHRGDRIEVVPEGTYAVRFTSLHPDVSVRIDRWLRTKPPLQWVLHNHVFAVDAIYCDKDRHNWSDLTTYDELAAKHMLGTGDTDARVSLEFASPTAFRSGGIHVPVPMPGLVFGSLVDRWNAFSSVQLPDDMRAFGETAVAVSRYQLRTESLQHKGNATMIGAIGVVTYTAMERDRYWLAVMNLLADFALYSGVGIKTTSGMGQVRRSG